KELKQKLAPLIRHLEQSVNEEFLNQIQEQVIKEHKIHELEWANRWFEWRRFLIMRLICKEATLYSREVNEIWYEVIKMPDQYETFLKKLIGNGNFQVPQLPNEGFDPNQRAW